MKSINVLANYKLDFSNFNQLFQRHMSFSWYCFIKGHIFFRLQAFSFQSPNSRWAPQQALRHLYFHMEIIHQHNCKTFSAVANYY
ncbi:GSCOCG00010743001-RA-CDS [Cotesia congregata]|nr:GSCOCG00010743001-RA-CDS [Cotesia congregata]